MTVADELIQLGPDDPLLTMLSLGIGQDSTAIAVRLVEEPALRQQLAPGRLIAAASDTGNEHEHTYEYIPELEKICSKGAIEFHWLTGGRFHSAAWATLHTQWERNNTVGCKAFRKSCTDNLKIQPLYRFLSWYVQQHFDIYVKGREALERFSQYYGKIRVVIGFTVDEQDRIIEDSKRPSWHRAAVELRYPLIEWGWKREDCVNYIRERAYPMPFPSNCEHCPYSTELDILWLSRHKPASFARWVQYEQRKLEKFAHLGEKNYGVFGKRTLMEVLRDVEATHGHLSNEELTASKFKRGHCVRSRY